jgi:hypothetical protein
VGAPCGTNSDATPVAVRGAAVMSAVSKSMAEP